MFDHDTFSRGQYFPHTHTFFLFLIVVAVVDQLGFCMTDEFLGEVVVPLSSLSEKDVLRIEQLQPNPKRNNGIKVKGALSFSGKFEAEGTYKDDIPIASKWKKPLFLRFSLSSQTGELGLSLEMSSSKSTTNLDQAPQLISVLGVEGLSAYQCVTTIWMN